MSTFTKEVIINFRIKTRGLYEIIEPVLEANEVFDSSLLKESINSLIASGKRNFAIDMSPLDYIYSDTINILMAMNKRVLDVTGRLSLMSPQPEVLQILKRAGIHNILRIFETETELIQSSEDMILQTTSIKLSDVNAALQQGPPQSEFDQLRSEIGSVFGSATADVPPRQASPAPTQGRAGSEDDFNQMFQQFETGAPASSRAGFGIPPAQPQIPQPQPPKFQPRPPQQPAAQPIPLRPAAPAYPRQSAEPPKAAPDFSTVRSETQRFTTAPAAQFQEQRSAEPPVRETISFDEDSSFETAPREKPAKKARMREDFDSFDEEDSGIDGHRKKSPIPMLIIVLLIVALIGAGGFIYYSSTKKSESVASVSEKPVQTPQSPAVQTPSAPPQLPVETAMPTPPPVPEAVATPEPKKEIVETRQEPPPPVRRAAPKPAARRSTPPPARSEPRPEPTINQVVFSTTPSGASVIINDQRVGTTPFTWTKPFFGTINVQISKPGFKTLQNSFDFTGGSMKESYSLEKEVAVAPPPPPPPPPEPVIPQRQEPVKPSTQTSASPSRAAAEEEDPFADIGSEESDFSSEEDAPAPARQQPSTVRSTATTTPTRSTYTPSSSASSGGGEALIFIASIPPVADVFLGDKLIGKTNVSELKIPAGMQTLRFVKGGKEITKQLNLQTGKNPSQMVRIP